MPTVSTASKVAFVMEVEKLDGGGSLCLASMLLAVILRLISRRPAVAVVAIEVFGMSSLGMGRIEGLSV